MKESTKNENEVERLTQLWEDLADKFEGNKVRCTRSSKIEYPRKSIELDKKYTVKKIDMYLGTTPCVILEETEGMWSIDKFELII